MTIIRRGQNLYLKKRVPLRFRSLEPREAIWISLATGDLTEAQRRADQFWKAMIEGWEAMEAGARDDAAQQFDAAIRYAKSRGVKYLEARKVAELPLPQVLERIEEIRSVEPGKAVPKQDPVDAQALLGGARQPDLRVSQALDTYFELTRHELVNKSEDQVRKWKNPRKKAIAGFIELVGDKPVTELTPDDLLAFRNCWQDRIITDGLQKASANKDLIHLKVVLRTVAEMKNLNLDLPFDRLKFKGATVGQRPAFSVKWIREKLLAPGALSKLNTEARCLVLGMVNTGYRPSEGCNLTEKTIRLDGRIPYIEILPDAREVKTAYSIRKIPLTGVSLEAFRECRTGFPRYRDNASALSALVNAYFRDNKLNETPDHTLYSLRHSFEDRMLAAGIDDRIRRDLFGHKLDRQKYGQGASLTQMHGLLVKMAL